MGRALSRTWTPPPSLGSFGGGDHQGKGWTGKAGRDLADKCMACGGQNNFKFEVRVLLTEPRAFYEAAQRGPARETGVLAS